MKRILLMVAATLSVAAVILTASPGPAIAGEARGDEVGFFDAATGLWSFPGEEPFYFGNPGDKPMSCDWDGDGLATVGQYRDTTGFLYLRNTNNTGVADVSIFYGIPGDMPVCGDWDGNGSESIGIYRRSDNKFYLRNSNTQGVANEVYSIGLWDGGVPFAGDFDGDGVDTVGVMDPATGYFQFGNPGGGFDREGYFGTGDDQLVFGDWDGNGTDDFGVYRPASSSFLLSTFGGSADVVLYAPGDGRQPISGDWVLNNGLTGFGGELPIEPKPAPKPVEQPAVAAPSPSLIPSPAPSPLPAPSPSPAPAPAPDGGTAPATSQAPGGPLLPDGAQVVPVPSGAVDVWPGDNLQSMVDSQGEGASFHIRAGYHYGVNVTPKRGQTFVGESGAVLRGSKQLTNWQWDGSRWYVDGQTQSNGWHGECESTHGRCGHPEELFFNGERLFHANSVGDVGWASWHFDYGSNRIYVGRDPAGQEVETSVEDWAFHGSADDVTISGLIIERYANRAQHGAIDTRDNNSYRSGGRWLIQANEVRNNHGVGISGTDGTRAVGNYIHNQGQLGIAGYGHDVVFDGNEVAYNNQAGFYIKWEAGGSKFKETYNLRLSNNYVHDNIGKGLWLDIWNYGAIYEGNTITNNTYMGIYHEVSYDAIIRNNYVAGNGFDHSNWLWGGGIVVANSPNVEIYGNTVIDNADGISVIHQSRIGQDVVDGWLKESHNVYVHDNHIELIGEGQTGYVQDVGDKSKYTNKGNWFENNTVIMKGRQDGFKWDDRNLDWDGWRGYGLS